MKDGQELSLVCVIFENAFIVVAVAVVDVVVVVVVVDI